MNLPFANGVSGFWIGIRDMTNGRTFKYESNLQPIGYHNWNSGEPNDNHSGEDCIEVYVDGHNDRTWNDFPCTNQLSFVLM